MIRGGPGEIEGKKSIFDFSSATPRSLMPDPLVDILRVTHLENFITSSRVLLKRIWDTFG